MSGPLSLLVYCRGAAVRVDGWRAALAVARDMRGRGLTVRLRWLGVYRDHPPAFRGRGRT